MVGGVPINVEKQMDYNDNVGHLHIHLKPGQQVLNGYQAMGFVRFRHADSDLMRQKRQHEFSMALKARLMERPYYLGNVAQQMVKMANGAFSDDEVASLVNFGSTAKKEDVKMGSIPVVDGPGYTLRVDRKRLDKVLKENLITDDESEIDYSDDSVR